MRTLLFSLLLTSSAYAVDFSLVLLDLRGDPILDESVHGPRDPVTKQFTGPRACTMDEYKAKPNECDALTLGAAAANALLWNDPDDSKIDEKEKRRRGNLADRVYHGGKFDLGVDDLALIKRLLSKLYGNLVVSRAIPLLDPATEK